MISDAISKIAHNSNLSYEEMRNVMNDILDAKIPVDETVDLLKNLTAKGESDDELLAMLDVMRAHAIHIEPTCQGRLVDVCGTGGDKMRTFNVSTTAAFVIAAGGVSVAKHGNRSSTGASGSADIFEYFGYDLNMEPDRIKDLIERFHIGFMFAQRFHPAMKNVAEARKRIGIRTAFNLIGPLCNPAGVKNQLVGVFSQPQLERVIRILQSRGAESVMTVISEDGLDELSTTSKNSVYHFTDGKTRRFVLDPAELGLTRSNLSDIQISTKEEAARAIVSSLNNTGKKAMIDVTALNAAAGLIVGGASERFDEALSTAFEIIRSGKAMDLFEKFFRDCGNPGRVEEVLNS